MALNWYVVRTYSGHENKVKQFLESELEDNEHIKAKIEDILVPTEKVFEVKDGKKKSKTKNFFPGYILVHGNTAAICRVETGNSTRRACA